MDASAQNREEEVHPFSSRMDEETWVVPGAPLEGGAGWRIWYSRSGTGDFMPVTPTVLLAGQAQPIVTPPPWNLLPPYDGLNRRMGVMQVVLDNGHRAPGETYDLVIPEVPQRPFRWRSLPDGIEDGVSFVLASCFWLPNDKEGFYAAAIRQLLKLHAPVFKLLIGDQVYQDYPPNWFPLRDPVKRFSERYDQYWGHPAYQEVLGSTPNFFTCDDHEFWNGYPERKLYIPYTLTGGMREKNKQVACDLFSYYQAAANPTGRSFYRFSVGPVSFFVSDSRSQRNPIKEDHASFFDHDQWSELEDWARTLSGPGVLVLGQPLFGKVGDWKEPALRDFEESFARLCWVFETALAGNAHGEKHDILILTGDIHKARHYVGTLAGMPGKAEVHELVASPASRIGPDIMAPDVTKSPMRFTVVHHDARRTWEIQPVEANEIPAAHNNVAVISMSPGTRTPETNQPRVRFEMAIWQVKPYSRFDWSSDSPSQQSLESLKRLYKTEIELR